MKYAKLYKRAAAVLIDIIPIILMAWLFIKNTGGTLRDELIIGILIFIVFSCYLVFSHAKWGQSIGKMIMRIKVVNVENQKLRWWTAFKRYSVEILLGFLNVGLLYYDYFTLQEEALDAPGSIGRAIQIFTNNTVLHVALYGVPLLWVAVSVITVMVSHRRQSIHDLMAGTVVVEA